MPATNYRAPVAAPPHLRAASAADGAYIPVTVLGLVAVMASLALGIALGLEAGDLFAQDAAARAADLGTQGTLAAIGGWNPALMLTGASLLMTAVVVVLQQIIRTIRVRGQVMAENLPRLLAPERS